ncbi:MAG TPA: TPM domain-containing protein, partial [Negativicutes bacterium]|nr:TPM domain-containing protein [Negativicutes bacterium]
MIKRIAAWLAIVGCVLLLAGPALAAPKIPPVPTRDIYAQDYGDVLSRETESQINRLSTELNSRTRAQIAVVTIPSLEGELIEEYSLALFRKWGIGDRKLNNGVLILVAVAEKKSRIEIGYGLEGALPDAKVGRILDEFMRPGMETGDYNTAVKNTYTAVLQEVATEYQQQMKTTTRTSPKNSGASSDIPVWQQLLIGGGILLFLLFDWFVLGGFFTQLLLALAFSGGGRGGG